MESIVLFLAPVWYWVMLMPNSEAQPLKVLVAGDLNFQAGSELKDENSNQMQRELLEKADAYYIDTTMCVY